ncbi:MAG TPA: hypothetical protein VJ952_05525 [Opitutales bacterium]|nr:hypothetical protein [Opitutales bacterium]
MKKQILAKRTRIIAVAALLLMIIAFFTREKEPSFLEVERQKAFQRHADTSNRARLDFGERYNRLSPEEKRADAIFQALDLPEPSSFKPISLREGHHEAIVDLPDKYSRLILEWDTSGKPNGYAWEGVSPAANNVSWKAHLESFAVGE